MTTNESSSVGGQMPHLRIEVSRGWSPVNLPELWQHRELLFFLILREIRSATRSTRLGLLWIVLQPLAIAAVLTVVLGTFIKIPTEDVPYVLVVLSGYLPWSYVSNAVTRASNSMVASSYLLTKVYFPRLIIPAVPILAGLVELGIFLVLLVAVATYFGISPRQTWLLLPIAAALAVGLATGAGLWFSALTVRIRDVGHAVPVMLQIVTYASPVLYPVALVPPHWRWLYDLNPMVGIIELTRWSLYANGAFPLQPLVSAIAGIGVLIATGIFYFRFTEDTAADIV